MVNGAPAVTVDDFNEVSIFKSFSKEELQSLISNGSIIKAEPHSNVIIEGELSWGIYIILSGFVGIFRQNKLTGQSWDIGQLREGAFFGEISLVDDDPRSATVQALAACVFFYISKDVFVAFLSESHSRKLNFYLNCTATLVKRLRELDDNYVISQYQLWQKALKKGGKLE